MKKRKIEVCKTVNMFNSIEIFVMKMKVKLMGEFNVS